MNDQELVAALRERAEMLDGWNFPLTKMLCAEAADRLEVLLSTPEPSDDDLHGHEWRCNTCGERMRQGMSEVEVTHDELAKAIDDGYGGTWTGTVADTILTGFRVSRRDGEDRS